MAARRRSKSRDRGAYSRSVCDVECRCCCRCRLWRYIIVMPFTFCRRPPSQFGRAQSVQNCVWSHLTIGIASQWLLTMRYRGCPGDTVTLSLNQRTTGVGDPLTRQWIIIARSSTTVNSVLSCVSICGGTDRQRYTYTDERMTQGRPKAPRRR